MDVKDTAEALRALYAQIPKLRQTIQQGFYKIRIGKEYIDNRYLEQGLFYRLKQGMTVHITPVVKGAKKMGVFQVIVGVALIGAAFALGPMGFAMVGKSTALMMGGMGASMLLGGVAQMLTKTPSMDMSTNDTEKKQSTAFGNIQNMVAQGNAIPLAYGQIRCGSLIISQGVETYTVDEVNTTNKKVGFRKG